MRVKVISPIMIFNGRIYHEGDYVEVENEEKKERMIRGCSVVDAPDLKPKHIENIRPKPKRVKKGRRKNGNHNTL